MFTEIVGNYVVLRQGGVYFKAAVAKCSINTRVYAKVGRGYVTLGAGDATSSPKISRVCELQEAPNVVVRDKFKGPEFVCPA